MAALRRGLLALCGVALVVLGLLDYHVEVGAIIIGLALCGLVTGEQLGRLIDAARGRRTKAQVDPRPTDSPGPASGP